MKGGRSGGDRTPASSSPVTARSLPASASGTSPPSRVSPALGGARGRRRPQRRHRRHASAVGPPSSCASPPAPARRSWTDDSLVEGAVRQRTPTRRPVPWCWPRYTLIFLIVTVALWPMALHTETYMTAFAGGRTAGWISTLGTDVPTLVAHAGVSDPDDHRGACWRPSASRAWTGRCGRTSSPTGAARRGGGRRRGHDCCWTRPATLTRPLGQPQGYTRSFIPPGRFHGSRSGATWRTLASVATRPRAGQVASSTLFQKMVTGRRPGAVVWRHRSRRGRRIHRVHVPRRAMSGIDLPDCRQDPQGATDAVLRYVQLQTRPGARPAATARGRGPGRAGPRRWWSVRATRWPAWWCLEDILKPACASASSDCGAWGCGRSWSPGDKPIDGEGHRQPGWRGRTT